MVKVFSGRGIGCVSAHRFQLVVTALQYGFRVQEPVSVVSRAVGYQHLAVQVVNARSGAVGKEQSGRPVAIAL